MALISLIIPVYNAEPYLLRCLDSVLAQDYKELEIVLIDDGSTDGSPIICDKYAKQYNNIMVWHVPNGGASLARKRGIEVAKGEYFTFIDSDDFVAANYVSAMYALIEKYGTKIGACGVKRVMPNENNDENENNNENEKLLTFDELMPRFFKYEYWGLPAGLYHQSVFEELTFPKSTLSEDYYIKTQMFCREKKMAVTTESLYFYEYHTESLSHTKLSPKAFEEFDNVKSVYEYTLLHCPKFAKYAMSNVVETAVKLCVQQKGNNYNEFFLPVYTFLRLYRRAIFFLPMLNPNVRIVALGLSVAPAFTRSAFQLLAKH